MLEEVSELAFCDLTFGEICVWQIVCKFEAGGCGSSLFEETPSSSSECMAKLSGVSGLRSGAP